MTNLLAISSRLELSRISQLLLESNLTQKKKKDNENKDINSSSEGSFATKLEYL